MALSLHTTIARGTRHVETDVGDQTMMMSVHTGKYYALEGTARSIWEQIAAPTTVDALIESLLREFDVERATCEADVMTFLDDMVANELVVATAPGSDA